MATDIHLATPLQIPSTICQAVDDDSVNAQYPKYQVLQRLVTRSHDGSSIETTLEQWMRRKDEASWMRVAIWSGPEGSANRVLHASYRLPEDAQPSTENALCWASFVQHADHPLLAVLVHPSALVLYDVYPDAKQSLLPGGDGWTVSLPFDCCGIFCSDKALLLQRWPDEEDPVYEEAGDGFFLKAPPTLPRGSIGGERDGPPPVLPPDQGAMAVASLFSLHHPLQDVLPICQQQSAQDALSAPAVTDVREKILWVGTTEWYSDGKQQSQTIMVTFHEMRRRHAVWLLQDAPPAGSAPPLWQRSKHWRPVHADWNNMLVEDDFDGELEQQDLHDHKLSRTDALADALGVKRPTPMPPPEASRLQSHRRGSTAAADSFVSPRGANQSMVLPADEGGPFGAVQSKLAVTCVWEEQGTAQELAEQVFLASNLEGSGTLVLALVCRSNDQDNPKELALFSLTPSANEKLSLTVTPLERLPCVAAQPVEATPVPLCFANSRTNNSADEQMATDILLLSQRRNDTEQQRSLVLYRACHPVTVCIIEVDGKVSNLRDGIRDYVTLEYIDASGRLLSNRGRVTLTLSSVLATRALSAIDAALFCDGNAPLIQLALGLRADACRLAEAITGGEALVTDVGWSALESVLNVVVDRELLGQTNLSKVPSEVQENDDAWEELLGSEFHRSYTLGNGESLYLGSLPTMSESTVKFDGTHTLASIGSLSLFRMKEAGLLGVIPHLFDALHLLYEDCKVSVSADSDKLMRLASFLARTCQAAKTRMRTTIGTMADRFLEYYQCDVGELLSTLLDVSAPIVAEATQNPSLTSFQSPPNFYQWVNDRMLGKMVPSYYEGVTSSEINAACTKTRAVRHIFSVLLAGDNPGRDLDVVNALLEEGFASQSMLREQLPVGIVLPILEVLHHRCRCDPTLGDVSDWSVEAWTLVGRDDISKNMSDASIRAHSRSPQLPVRNETEEHDSSFDDKDDDGLVPLERRAAMLFPDDNRIHEAARLLRSSRPIFLRVPRAIEVTDHDYEKQKQSKLSDLCRRTLALSVGRGMLTLGSLDVVAAEPLPQPELVLKGRVPPTNASLAFDTSDCPTDMTVWPEFHNGVAAGLRLPMDEEVTHGDFKITRTWIVYNKPPPTPQSQEDSSESTPVSGKEHAHGGLLLALGLRGHLTALEMSDVYEYLTRGTVTTTVGVLLGMAANKRGTCDMSVSKMLCLHIPSLIPQHFSAIDVASSVQAAAVTGAGLLFQRSSHRMMTEFLLNEIGKRPDSDLSAFDREAYTLSCGLALGMVNLCLGEKSGDENRAAGIADLRVEDRLHRYIVGGIDEDELRRTRETNDRFSLPSASNNGDNEKCSIVFEGDAINTDVTAPGATLALGLMYMKTGNYTIASALALPDTHFLLEFVRPDFLGLRVISRSLILWNDVQPTDSWIDAQIPAVVRAAYDQMRAMAKDTIAGRPTDKGRRKLDYDRRAVRQIYVHVLVGACFGLGLRFAGTGDKQAADVIFKRVLELQKLRDAKDAVSAALRPEFPILETCLGCAAISLAMVLAGTGDVEALKLFKILRWRCEEDITYGTHLVYGMAIGLLFLGGGTCTLGREPEDLAALVCAFFPRYPASTSDNQYHLQALRHLYVLAVKRKELVAVDVETGESVSVPVVVEAGQITQYMTVPCLLRNSDQKLRKLRVVSKEYYPLTVDLDKIAPMYTFYVKKRNTHDPYSVRWNRAIVQNSALIPTQTPFMRAYAEHFGQDGSHQDDDLFTADPDVLYVHVALEHGLKALRDGCSASTLHHFLRNLQLVSSYYQQKSSGGQLERVVSQEWLAYLHEQTERALTGVADMGGVLSFYDGV